MGLKHSKFNVCTVYCSVDQCVGFATWGSPRINQRLHLMFLLSRRVLWDWTVPLRGGGGKIKPDCNL